jgi:SWI/SNF-related matrix-associated actin-dependent regulator of chromatin subfamily D
MDLVAFERKLDATIMRKRLDIQEALKRPIKVKRKLRVFITNQFYPGKTDADNDEDCVPQWELKIEGRLLDDVNFKIIITSDNQIINQLNLSE